MMYGETSVCIEKLSFPLQATPKLLPSPLLNEILKPLSNSVGFLFLKLVAGAPAKALTASGTLKKTRRQALQARRLQHGAQNTTT